MTGTHGRPGKGEMGRGNGWGMRVLVERRDRKKRARQQVPLVVEMEKVPGANLGFLHVLSWDRGRDSPAIPSYARQAGVDAWLVRASWDT
jgi:hypothetical protein